MEMVKSEALVQNDNLYRALVSAPIAILFLMLAKNALASPGLIFMTFLFIVMATYFTLSTLAYAAFSTNDHHAEDTGRTIENRNLLRTVLNSPVALALVYFAYLSITSGAHLFISVLLVLVASYFSLKAIAHAAFYTNDFFAAHE